ncbi:MAG: pyridoxamine 5'-phosphate oxidase family protein [Actinobacteria bacterium]|nr:pyridoxamine 5'-phosphate oxidase family protein [Actinomycetota bacterium]
MSAPQSARSTVRRAPHRADYDRGVIYEVLDSALYCHTGFVVDAQPYVIPTIHARVGDTLYIHGSPASRMLRVVRAGAPVCVTVTLLDGLVLARSAFHHSMNYRSVVVLGGGREVVDAEEKLAAFRALVERVVPGRWGRIRRPTTAEFARTQVLAVGLDESSAKIRTGPPVDDEDDYSLEVWAGVIPVEQHFGAPIDDPRLIEGLSPPSFP